MKTRFCAALLLAALAFTILSGCSVNALQQLDQAEDVLDHRLDAMEEKLKNRIESAFTEAAVPKAPAPVPSTTPVKAVLLTGEEAEKIALEHAKLSATDVVRLKTEFDYDHGQPEYDVEFHHGGYEYDYEIHAETGKVITWDKELDD